MLLTANRTGKELAGKFLNYQSYKLNFKENINFKIHKINRGTHNLT
jgi:hypothetical protein